MHTENGTPNIFDGGPFLDIWSQLWQDVGNDRENKVVIITSTGDYWIYDEEYNQDLGADPLPFVASNLYLDAVKNLQNAVFCLNVPTIGALNGPSIPGVHTEFALLCDITICTPNTEIRDGHYDMGVAPGDGLGIVLQHLLGTKRAAYMMLTGNPINSKEMLDTGLVNEVVPKAELLPRAWSLAEEIMKMPEVARVMTTQITRRPIKKVIADDATFHFAHETAALFTDEGVNPQRAIDRGLEIDRVQRGE
jgi:enoyl-CoA hydratase/carnithine racemase